MLPKRNNDFLDIRKVRFSGRATPTHYVGGEWINFISRSTIIVSPRIFAIRPRAERLVNEAFLDKYHVDILDIGNRFLLVAPFHQVFQSFLE